MDIQWNIVSGVAIFYTIIKSLFFIALVVAFIYFVIVIVKKGSIPFINSDPYLIVRKRYAKGEISTQEYEEIIETLRKSDNQ